MEAAAAAVAAAAAAATPCPKTRAPISFSLACSDGGVGLAGFAGTAVSWEQSGGMGSLTMQEAIYLHGRLNRPILGIRAEVLQVAG